MRYDFDIPTIIRRFVPVWFRKPTNLAWAYALARRCEWIHTHFLVFRARDIEPLFQYNGLLHSLEWMVNDVFDPVQRRIYITVSPQVPVMYHHDQGDAAVVQFSDEGTLTGYYHLDEGEVHAPYRHEFVVNVPMALASLNTSWMFELLDRWRWAGRRPAIRFFDPLYAPQWVYYNASSPIFNQL